MTSIPGLRALAQSHGIQTSYHDANGARRETSTEALLAVLTAFGAPVRSPADVPAAARQRRLEVWRRVLPMGTVVWGDTPGLVDLRLPASMAAGTCHGTVSMEDGRQSPVSWDLSASGPSLAEDVEGERFLLYRLPLPAGLPMGYHRLQLAVPGGEAESLILAAPVRCASGPERAWGVFLPLYALRSAYDWGVGDYIGLAELSRWAAGLGASTVGTLPLLPTFLDDPLEPSPYAPISRLAWNPLYVDVLRAPGTEHASEAEAVHASQGIHAEVEALRRLPEVDYAGVMALKRRALEELSGAEANRETLQRFAAEQPDFDAYARFMAVREAQGKRWQAWPERLRSGVLGSGDYAEEVWRYHLYGQLAASEQMEALHGADDSAELYLDYPVGVHPEGFDVWREQGRFVTDVTVGAPPDAFFTRGQDWGFNPLHPERSGDHRYSIASLRHHMRFASLLRLDHVMGLHRLYWVPRGAGPADGAYVRYPHEEMYAILAIESHRNGTGVVGEDLGTVPPAVPRAMARHGLKRMFVLQFAVHPDKPRPVGWPSKGMVASVNTHDTPAFAGYWRGLDIDDRHALGLMDEAGAREERAEREAAKRTVLDWLRKHGHLDAEDDEAAVVRALYTGLASSRADLVLANLEDLWQEPLPQNVPGTSVERPNWKRKARYTVEEFTAQSPVRELLGSMTQHRRKADGR
ncbi:MAG: 4-alpha-glucanotransferase [Dehalococcoidia bacterium]